MEKVIKIIIGGNAGGGISALTQTRNALTSIEGSIGRVKSLLYTLGGAWAASKLFEGFGLGLKSVDDFQQAVAKTAALITSLQGGTDVADNYARAKQYAEGLNLALQQVDSRTTLNLDNLQAITEEMTKQGVILDYSNKSQVDAFTALANAGAVYSNNGAKESQLRQEIAALLRGEVNMNSQLATLIQRTLDGPLEQYVQKWKQSGTFLEEISKRLAGFGPASDDLSKTWGAVTSSLETALNVVLKAGFTAIVKDLSSGLDKVNQYLKEHKDELGEIIRDGWEKLKEAAETVADVVKVVWKNWEPFAAVIIGGAMVKGVKDLVKVFVELRTVLLGIHGALTIMGLTSGGAAAAGAAGTLAANGKLLGKSVAYSAAGGAGMSAAFSAGAGALTGTLPGWIGALGPGIPLGIGAGFAAQPLVRWADKKLYNAFGINLTGQEMFNQEQARGVLAEQNYQAMLAKKTKGAAANIPQLNLGPTPEQIKEQEQLADLSLKLQETKDKAALDSIKSFGKLRNDILKQSYDFGLVTLKESYDAQLTTATEAITKELEILDKRRQSLEDSLGGAKTEERRLQLQNEIAQLTGQKDQLLSGYAQARLDILQKSQGEELKAVETAREHVQAAEQLRQEYDALNPSFAEYFQKLTEVAGAETKRKDLLRVLQVAQGQGHLSLVAAIKDELNWQDKRIAKIRELATEQLKADALKAGNYALIAEAELEESRGNKILADQIKAEVAARNEVKRVQDQISDGLSQQQKIVDSLSDATKQWTDAERNQLQLMTADINSGIAAYRELLSIKEQALRDMNLASNLMRSGVYPSDNYTQNAGFSNFGIQLYSTPGVPFSGGNSVSVGSMNINVQGGDTAGQTGSNVALGTARALEQLVVNSMGG